MTSCPSNAVAGGAGIDGGQEGENEHGSRDMQVAPDEPSELLVEPAEKLTNQNVVKMAERSSLAPAEK